MRPTVTTSQRGRERARAKTMAATPPGHAPRGHVPGEEHHRHPDGEGPQGQDGIQKEEGAEAGGHPLSPPKPQKQGVVVAQHRRQSHPAQKGSLYPHRPRDQDGHPTLEDIKEGHHQGGPRPQGPEDIGGPDVARTHLADVHPVGSGHQNPGGYGAEEVGHQQSQKHRPHRGDFNCSPRCSSLGRSGKTPGRGGTGKEPGPRREGEPLPFLGRPGRARW